MWIPSGSIKKPAIMSLVIIAHLFIDINSTGRPIDLVPNMDKSIIERDIFLGSVIIEVKIGRKWPKISKILGFVEMFSPGRWWSMILWPIKLLIIQYFAILIYHLVNQWSFLPNRGQDMKWIHLVNIGYLLLPCGRKNVVRDYYYQWNITWFSVNWCQYSILSIWMAL